MSNATQGRVTIAEQTAAVATAVAAQEALLPMPQWKRPTWMPQWKRPTTTVVTAAQEGMVTQNKYDEDAAGAEKACLDERRPLRALADSLLHSPKSGGIALDTAPAVQTVVPSKVPAIAGVTHTARLFPVRLLFIM